MNYSRGCRVHMGDLQLPIAKQPRTTCPTRALSQCRLCIATMLPACYQNATAHYHNATRGLSQGHPHVTATPPAYNHNAASALFYACAACELLKCYPCNTAMPAEGYKFRGATRAESRAIATPPVYYRNATYESSQRRPHIIATSPACF